MPWTKVTVAINGLDRDFNWDKNKASLSFLGSFSPWGATKGKPTGEAEPQGWGLCERRTIDYCYPELLNQGKNRALGANWGPWYKPSCHCVGGLINTQNSFRAAVFTLLTFPHQASPLAEESLRDVRVCCIAARSAVVSVWQPVVKYPFLVQAGHLSCLLSLCPSAGRGLAKDVSSEGRCVDPAFLPPHGDGELFLLLIGLVRMSLWLIFLKLFYKWTQFWGLYPGKVLEPHFRSLFLECRINYALFLMSPLILSDYFYTTFRFMNFLWISFQDLLRIVFSKAITWRREKKTEREKEGRSY